jgi:periplasmic copper chaperone A
MRALGFLTVVSAVALAGCAKPEGLQVVDPVVRLSANPNAPSAGYFTIKGGPTADRLLNVSSPLVIQILMHDSVMEGGKMTMKSIDAAGVDVPANSTVKFEEGGKHLMLANINPGVKAGEKVQLTFTFASGTILQGYALVRPAGS